MTSTKHWQKRKCIGGIHELKSLLCTVSMIEYWLEAKLFFWSIFSLIFLINWLEAWIHEAICFRIRESTIWVTWSMDRAGKMGRLDARKNKRLGYINLKPFLIWAFLDRFDKVRIRFGLVTGPTCKNATLKAWARCGLALWRPNLDN